MRMRRVTATLAVLATGYAAAAWAALLGAGVSAQLTAAIEPAWPWLIAGALVAGGASVILALAALVMRRTNARPLAVSGLVGGAAATSVLVLAVPLAQEVIV